MPNTEFLFLRLITEFGLAGSMLSKLLPARFSMATPQKKDGEIFFFTPADNKFKRVELIGYNNANDAKKGITRQVRVSNKRVIFWKYTALFLIISAVALLASLFYFLKDSRNYGNLIYLVANGLGRMSALFFFVWGIKFCAKESRRAVKDANAQQAEHTNVCAKADGNRIAEESDNEENIKKAIAEALKTERNPLRKPEN